MKANYPIEVVPGSGTVIVERLSDFASSPRELLEKIEQLQAQGVVFVSKKEGLDTSTQEGQAMIKVIAAVVNMR